MRVIYSGTLIVAVVADFANMSVCLEKGLKIHISLEEITSSNPIRLLSE